MIGSRRIRRIGVLVAGAALVLVAGCTVRGTTSIRAGSSREVVPCDPNNQQWIVPPEATQLRFEVTSSDTTQPLEASVYLPEGPFSFGTVWHGTKSTGPKLVPLVQNGTQGVYVWIERVDHQPFSQTTEVSWAFTALDANGNDVGFAGCAGT